MFSKKKGIYAAARQVYANYKNSAEHRGHPFELDFDLFAEVIQQNCYYCGAEPNNLYERHNVKDYYSGIDRIDNTKGYFPDNIVPCCIVCNRAKFKMTTKEFLGWAKQLARHQFWLYENQFYED